jgi:hypothetical protein
MWSLTRVRDTCEVAHTFSLIGLAIISLHVACLYVLRCNARENSSTRNVRSDGTPPIIELYYEQSCRYRALCHHRGFAGLGPVA